MILNWAKQQTALLIGGSSTTIPNAFLIGIGSSTVQASQTALITASDKQDFTSKDSTTIYKTTFQGDWNSIEMSGLNLQEFGITTSGTGLTGSLWSRVVIPSINFDGSNELQLTEIWEVY